MRAYPIGLIPLFLATTAYSQTIDPAQNNWDLRRGESAIAEPVRLRPGADASALTSAETQIASAATVPLVAPYTGHSVFGGTLTLGTGFGVYYDDNVFASSTRPRTDGVIVARPEFAWQMSGQGYAVGVDGFLEAKRFERYDSEDQANGSIGTQFKVAPTPDSQVIGGARYVHGHLDRGTSETIGPNGVLLSTLFQTPISYDQGTASLVYNRRFDQWWTSIGANGTVIKFQNPDIAGLAQVDLSYADGNIEVVNGRIGRVVAPLTSVFGEVAVNTRNFGVDAFNSVGYRVVGGVLLEPGQGARARGEVWGGYMNQDYRGSSFRTVSTFTYGGNLNIGLADGLSMAIEGRREAKEAALSVGTEAAGLVGVTDSLCSVASAACVSAVQSSIGGRLDYKIRPNLVIGGGATYIIDQYLGAVAAGRMDHTISPVASLKYAPTNRFTMGLDYRRVNFDPNGGGASGLVAPSYARNIYMASIAGKF